MQIHRRDLWEGITWVGMKNRIQETEIFKEVTTNVLNNGENLDEMQVKNAIKTPGLTTAEMREIRDLTEEAMSELTTVGLIKEEMDQVVLIGKEDQWTVLARKEIQKKIGEVTIERRQLASKTKERIGIEVR